MHISITTFMKVALTVLILTTLLIGAVYQSLSDKNDQHQELIQTEHQIQLN
jgi:hypothetical protein